jgi:hypothetical protein
MSNNQLIVCTHESKVLSPHETARTGDVLEACFISCLIYGSDRAIIGHYGPHPSFCDPHFRKIRELHKDLGETVSRGFLFTRDTNPDLFFGLNMTLDEYVASRDAFAEELSQVIGSPLTLETYMQGNVIRLGLNREPTVRRF